MFNGVLSTPLRESLSFLVFALTVYSLQVMVDQHLKNADTFFLYKPVWAGICKYSTDPVRFTYTARSYFQVFFEIHMFEVVYHMPKYTYP